MKDKPLIKQAEDIELQLEVIVEKEPFNGAAYDKSVINLRDTLTENKKRVDEARAFLNASPPDFSEEGITHANDLFSITGIDRDELEKMCEFWEIAAETTRERLELAGLPTHPGKEAARYSLPSDVQTAIEHAMDVLSKHGDSTVSVGAMITLESFIQQHGSSNTPVTDDLEDEPEGPSPG